MFWTSSGKRVEKSTLNGVQRDVIHEVNNTGISCPYGITLDRQHKLVFWTDYCGDKIESSDYNGNSRKLLIHMKHGVNLLGVSFISSLLFTGGHLRDTIYKVNTSNGTVFSNVQLPFYDLRGIVAYDCTLQPQGLFLRKFFYSLHERRNAGGRWK